jgi:hypothetical protein
VACAAAFCATSVTALLTGIFLSPTEASINQHRSEPHLVILRTALTNLLDDDTAHGDDTTAVADRQNYR